MNAYCGNEPMLLGDERTCRDDQHLIVTCATNWVLGKKWATHRFQSEHVRIAIDVRVPAHKSCNPDASVAPTTNVLHVVSVFGVEISQPTSDA